MRKKRRVVKVICPECLMLVKLKKEILVESFSIMRYVGHHCLMDFILQIKERGS